MLFVARRAITRTHRACVELSTLAVVVTHLHGFGEAAGGVATGPRNGRSLGHRVALYVPGGPVEDGLEFDCPVGSRRGRRRKPEERTFIHLGRVDNLARVEQSDRV